VEEIAAQTGATACDSAIGEEEVDSAKRGWDVNDEEAVEEADRCGPGSSE
jgi:hypothetical protein